MIGPQSAVILSHPCFNGVEEQHESADWFLGCQWILNLLLLLGFLFSRDFLSFFASPFPRSCGPLLPQQLLDFSKGGVWVQSGQKWPKVAKTSKVAQSGPKWPKVAQSGPKWPKVAQSGPKWSKVAQSGPNIQSGPKWPKVAQSGPNSKNGPK